MELEQAIAMVKAAGYTVSRRKAKAKVSWPLPVAQAVFANGEVVRMSIYTPRDNPDEDRGRRLCAAAYQVRRSGKPWLTAFCAISDFRFV